MKKITRNNESSSHVYLLTRVDFIMEWLPCGSRFLELGELLLLSWGLGVLDHVEADGLGQGSALAHGDDITLLNIKEGGGHVDGHVLKTKFMKTNFTRQLLHIGSVCILSHA